MTGLEVSFQHRFPGGFALDVAFRTEAFTTSLFGPSGSGKSSVLAVIAGLLHPHSGRVALGEDVWLDSQRGVYLPPERRRVGVVFQDPLLFPHMSVEANLRYGLRRRRHGSATRIHWARVLEVLELAPLLGRRPSNLSGGERQRVGLGRALLHDPALLLLDEPLVSLDEALKQRILAYLDRVLREWRIPTLYVSHAQAEVRRLAQWVVALEAGRVADSGPTDEVLTRLLERDGSGPAAPTNLLCVEVAKRPAADGWNGKIGDQLLQLPAGFEPTSDGRCFLHFTAQAVNLSTGPIAAGLSARNRLVGTVQRLLAHPTGVLVLVDVGQPVWAEVTTEAIEALGLHPGAQVTCLIKTTGMQVIP